MNVEKTENQALRELLFEVIDKGDNLRRFTDAMSNSREEAFAVNEWGRIKAKANRYKTTEGN